MVEPYVQCIIPFCGKTYEIHDIVNYCSCGNLADVKYKNLDSGLLANPEKAKKEFAKRLNHGGDIFNMSGVWRFRELIPFYLAEKKDFHEVLVSYDGMEGHTMPLHYTPVAEYVGLPSANLWIQHEGLNPAESFKANGMATGFTHARIVDARDIICASTGNTAASAAAFAANEGMRVYVLMAAEKVGVGKYAKTLEFRGKVMQIEGGKFDDAMSFAGQLPGKYMINSNNPYRPEGQETIIYRLLEGMSWKVPDFISYPFGNGANISSAGNALKKLYQLGFICKIPRLVAVNAEGANTLDVLVNQKGLKWNNGEVDTQVIKDYYNYLDNIKFDPITVASAIAIGKPVNIVKALRALEFTNGIVVSVSDSEIMDAKAVIGGGMFGCEPASASTIAAAKMLVDKGIIDKDAVVAAILTGSSSNDPDATIKYHTNPANKFANPPIVVENNLEAILKILE